MYYLKSIRATMGAAPFQQKRWNTGKTSLNFPYTLIDNRNYSMNIFECVHVYTQHAYAHAYVPSLWRTKQNTKSHFTFKENI